MEPFQVYARIRPANSKELSFYNQNPAVTPLNSTSLSVSDSQLRQTVFQLDQVFDENDDNAHIFQTAIAPAINASLSGINSTILAYGITGAGKSHTMFGSKSEGGLIQLALEYICGDVASSQTRITMSYMEIYNEQVYDLLRPNSESLQIIDDPVAGVIAHQLSELEIHSSKSAQALIELGNTRRVVAETKANEFSSRSHAIVQINIETKNGDSLLIGKLSMVDLAGSERQTVYSDQKGLRNFEGSNINRSLLTLGNCITMLSEKRKGGFVPYRDSKLTRLLKDSLGGNTKTVMIACVSPSILSYDETLNTLKYACRARKIQKVVLQNVKENRNNEQLRKEVVRLQRQLELKEGSQRQTIQREQMQNFIQKLIKNVEALTTARLKQTGDLSTKMLEVDLMEEQHKLVGAMLLKCCPQNIPQKQQIRCSTPDLQSLIPRRGSRQSSGAQIEHIMCGQSPFGLIPEASMERQQSAMVEPNSCLFVRGNLQNARIRYQKQKKMLKDSTKEYIQKWQDPSERRRIAESIRSIVDRSNNAGLFGQVNQEIVERIVREERVDSWELEGVNRQEPKFILEDLPEVVDTGKQLKEPSTRFLSSLREIRRMMHRFSGSNAAEMLIPDVQQESLEVDRQLFVST